MIEEISTPHDLGQRVILPSSYIGGPRHQQQRYQDAMAIVRHFKHINLFITMTANLKWEEITRELFPGQTSYNCPDIVAHIFKLKKEQLIDDIYKNCIFGQAVTFVYVIEFQKRGLPHLHLLVVLKHNMQLLYVPPPTSIPASLHSGPIQERSLYCLTRSSPPWFTVHMET